MVSRSGKLIKHKKDTATAVSFLRVEKLSGAGAPKAPLCKGSCHASSMTEGLSQKYLRFALHERFFAVLFCKLKPGSG